MDILTDLSWPSTQGVTLVNQNIDEYMINYLLDRDEETPGGANEPPHGPQGHLTDVANPVSEGQLRARYQDGQRWFHRLSMEGVKLEGINLSESSMESSDFTGANLKRSNFRKALLNCVDFSGADLRHANLCGADLRCANLCGADLRGANLSGAKIDGASFKQARYDARTRWSKGFDPEDAHAILLSVLIDQPLLGKAANLPPRQRP